MVPAGTIIGIETLSTVDALAVEEVSGDQVGCVGKGGWGRCLEEWGVWVEKWLYRGGILKSMGLGEVGVNGECTG